MTELARLTYLDFDLAIEALPAQAADAPTHRARVLNSPAGQATADFRLPFNVHELENYILKMARPRRSVRSLHSEEGAAALDFGRRLYDAVFRDEVRDALRRSLDAADRQPDQGLRIRLWLAEAEDLLDLPWEYLYDPTHRRFFCHSVATPLVRYPQRPRPMAPVVVTPPLQVLVMIANPTDVAALDVEEEWQKVQTALAPLAARGLVELTRLEAATLPALQRQLRQGRYHIFHFVGHGGVHPRTGEQVLSLEDAQGRARAVGGNHLGTLLRDHRSLQLVLLNACEGARTAVNDPFAGVAQQLVLQGIPAIIAMQFEITDSAAILLAHEFYTALADGYPVEAALAEARKAIFVAENDVEWGTPVLYTWANSGQLFSLASPPTQPVDELTVDEQVLTEPVHVDVPRDESAADENEVAETEAEDVTAEPTATPTIEPDTSSVPEPELAATIRDATPNTQDAARTTVVETQPTTPPQATAQKRWGRVLLIVAALLIVGYLLVAGINSYQQSQQRAVATATRQAQVAVAMAQATATGLAPLVAADMVASVPELRPLLDRFDMRLVNVPAGPFRMGSPDGVGSSDEHPQFSMEVVDFWIGQTEVTNAQYRSFVEAGGYDDERWWTESGWTWRTENAITEPRYWTDERWNGEQQPVVGVSWYEADAYVAWLAAETGLTLRLPTEAEWEKAARGLNGQRYPWDDAEPTAQLLNYNENVGQTAPVGSYPDGISPYGALDMAGNVWEWTATVWRDDYIDYADSVDQDREETALRALRGGSWYLNAYDVRSANRFRFTPDYRSYYFGFRIVFAPGS